MKQGVTLFNTERGDEAINGLPHRMALRTQAAKIARGGKRKLRTPCLKDLEATQSTMDLNKRTVVRDALQDFTKNQVGEAKTLPVDLAI